MGRRLQARRDDIERRALLRLTISYLGVFAAVIAALSVLAYAFVESTYRSLVAPALATPEGREGLAAAMRPALLAILSVDAALLVVVGAASFALARAALRPLAVAREREERFSADVAHELRTPLAAIASVAQAGEDGEPAAARAALKTIARRALECGELVGDLLTLARTSDADAIHSEPVDIVTIARRVCAERGAATSTVRIECDGESAIVAGDERRLVRLLRNLVDNALSHAVAVVRVSVRAENDEARIRVEDDGPGVARELEPRLFERFAKSRDSSGSGLGLAICRWIARAHGGDIAFLGGSVFVVRLPLAR